MADNSSVIATVNCPDDEASAGITWRAALIESWRKPAVAVSISTRTGVLFWPGPTAFDRHAKIIASPTTATIRPFCRAIAIASHYAPVRTRLSVISRRHGLCTYPRYAKSQHGG